MRLLRWFFVCAGALGLAADGRAQAPTSFSNPNLPTGNFSSGLTGIRPSDVQFRQIDTTSLLRAPVTPLQTAGQNRFSFTNLLGRVFNFGSRPVHGVSPLPDPKTVPGWQFPDSPIKPMRPIYPRLAGQ